MKDIMGQELAVNDKVVIAKNSTLGVTLVKGTVVEINRNVAYVNTNSFSRDDRCVEYDERILKFDWTKTSQKG